MSESFQKTPILDTLENYLSRNPIRMHVPFHAGIANNPIFPKGLYELDISEVSGYDVAGEDNPLFQSERITAQYFKVAHSFYLTGGASVGLLAALFALNKYGKKVIVSRNVHKSVINGLVLSGLEPVWLEVEFLNEWGIFSSVQLSALKKCISEANDLAGCIIVSPTYEGVISDIKAISKICHERNVPLVVDEAHGAHLYFLEPGSQSSALKAQHSALKCGADLVIQSWHKSLGSLTQTGVLHLVNDAYFSYKDIKRSLDLVSSTSPSFLLLLSLELTRKKLAETQGCYFETLFKNVLLFKSELEKIDSLSIFKNQDPLKVYLKSNNVSGINFAFELYKRFSVEVESANEIGLLMQIGVNFNDKVMNKVIESINKCIIGQWTRDKRQTTRKSQVPSPLLHYVCSPREAFLKGFHNKNMEYHTDVKAPCPPGYATSIPGMKIKELGDRS
ncbi:MAG: aminotransferase class I/II-fold pyridoxal phosphate-dependent enzyme [Candidatus Melainabacteria bacterium]|nr:aminotransferase class I/II-fold pyridoxal phosphate-dependent enzyme [Candidatus Melainabacteria bacterium]MBI3308630.1 aminotransferase class I/II-fold pyridoxal phosphate-dependent enzyme [Candidatus Melainabacteria bacterium]